MDNCNKNATGPEQGEVRCCYDYRVILIHIANILDALGTLVALDFGAKELNPVMAWALNQGSGLFLATKMLVISVAVEYLNKHLDGGKRSILTWIMAIFLATVVWHLYGLVVFYGSS